MLQNNIRANQRYKVLQMEKQRKAKIFDRDMNTLMGYILGISCNLDEQKQPGTEPIKPLDRQKKCRPSTSLGTSHSSSRTQNKQQFVRYASRNDFMKNQVRNKKPPHHKCENPKENSIKEKHVRFKPEPQIHIFEKDCDHQQQAPQPLPPQHNIERPSSAPALLRDRYCHSKSTFCYDNSWRRWHFNVALSEGWFPRVRPNDHIPSSHGNGHIPSNHGNGHIPRVGWGSYSETNAHVTASTPKLAHSTFVYSQPTVERI